MATEAQILANRRNAQNSTGPNSHKLFEIPSITLFLCAFCAFLWLKNPFNQRNPRLMKYSSCLSAFVAMPSILYNCRDIITFVVSALQIRTFLCKTKPNSEKVK